MTVAIAHEDEIVCHLLQERLSHLTVEVEICSSREEVLALRNKRQLVLLVDVAFEGIFPFQLIDELTTKGPGDCRIILLSSVYNRTAYKKRPDSLYGADAYLELHHIGDRLLPQLAEYFPSLTEQVARVEQIRTDAGERTLADEAVTERASALAKLLVADILLYHHDRLQKRADATTQLHLLREPLAEGERVLVSRLPQAKEMAGELLRQAFISACQDYQRNS
ncbi:hypothetical protein SAMN02745165_00661 [Malonomonas rubra DSM 5091]|uniref:Uncharacterized protein n=1 Tax=Malonomonas rubra DSM 5091 TaxID=1122189 RepID=A0A1M6DG53_MALRU|nr:hypothetical protein SAMN02745165_00661 [Malonomonas rubra DSM 5091]